MRGGRAGGGRELRVLSQWVQLYTGAQIKFWDLTTYLTYDFSLPSIPDDFSFIFEKFPVSETHLLLHAYLV